MTQPPRRLYLLDGMAIVYRAHFAFIRNPRLTSRGTNTSAIFGYVNTLLEILKNEQPTHLAVAFDTSEPTRRHVELPSYKAQRQEMPDELSAAMPYVFKVTKAMRIPVLRYPGYEADDVIGTLAKRASAEGLETWMVTPDKDFCQLVCEHVKLYKPTRDGVVKWGVAEVCEEWGVERVEQIVDILGLMGDASDNIPGIPGIGQKTAQKLIADYDSVENLIAHAAELKGKQKERVEEHALQAILSKQLAKIDIDVPVTESWDEMVLEEPNLPALRELFNELEFTALGKRFLGDEFVATGAAPAGATAQHPPMDLFEAAAAEADGFRRLADVEHDYRLVDTPEKLDDLVAQLLKQKQFCFDVETTSKDAHDCMLVGVAFSWQKGKGFYVPVPDEKGACSSLLRKLSPALSDPKIIKIGHNLKYDATVLRWNGIEVQGAFYDTMLAHYLIEPELSHSMDALARQYLRYDPVPISELIGPKGRDQTTMRCVSIKQVCDYACEDADITLQLWAVLEPMLAERNALELFKTVEAPLVPVLVEMEQTGICLDVQALLDYGKQLDDELTTLATRIHKLAGHEFNIDSPRQLGDVLFDELKLDPKAKRTSKTKQYTTTEQILMRLKGRHAIIQDILEYRTLRKLKGTYLDTLPHAVKESTGCIHTTYNQSVAATGRLASANPNLQNIPIRSEAGREIRKAFVPSGEGFKLLSADYSQIELRIIAQISGDEGLREAFAAGIDVHQATAARVYHVELDAVTPEMRSKAKMVNYGVSYGMSAWGLAQRLNISNSEAGEIITEYYRQFPGVQAYIDDTIKSARERGYVETLLGRRRYLPNINDSNATMRSAEERNAINAPIQGTAADMIKLAMVRIHRQLKEKPYRTRMLLQVHDELVFDLWLEERVEVARMILTEMTTALPMEVPIVVDMGVGDNWLTAH